MQRFNSHKDLVVWQESINLGSMVFKLVDQISGEDRERLGLQMQKAVVAISTGIAEGPALENHKEFIRVLRGALQKLAELDSLLALGRKLDVFPEGFELDEQISKVERMIVGLIRSLIRPPQREKGQSPRNHPEI